MKPGSAQPVARPETSPLLGGAGLLLVAIGAGGSMWCLAGLMTLLGRVYRVSDNGHTPALADDMFLAFLATGAIGFGLWLFVRRRAIRARHALWDYSFLAIVLASGAGGKFIGETTAPFGRPAIEPHRSSGRGPTQQEMDDNRKQNKEYLGAFNIG